MSIEKKSTHVRLDPEVDKMLAALSDALEKDKAEIAALLLTKQVIGEFHAISVAAERIERSGIRGIRWEWAQFGGSRRKSAEGAE